MKRTLFDILIFGALAVMAVLVAILFILPSMNWSATRKPGQVENTIASYVTSNWIRRNAAEKSNPFHPTSENLKAAQADFDRHCSGCHGLTGNAENRL